MVKDTWVVPDEFTKWLFDHMEVKTNSLLLPDSSQAKLTDLPLTSKSSKKTADDGRHCELTAFVHAIPNKK